MSVKQALHFKQIGIASYYDESSMMGIVSGSTSIGESVHPWHMHAAHPTLPLPCEVEVYSFRTRKSIKVRVNDRGPFVKDRIIDLSDEAAKRLGFKHQGLEKVAIRVLSVGDGKWKRKAEL
jgi:rare lipoprotein A